MSASNKAPMSIQNSKIGKRNNKAASVGKDQLKEMYKLKVI